MMPNVFAYDDFRQYLSDFFQHKKEEMPRLFTYKHLAKKAGFKSPSYFHRIIHGNRQLNAAAVARLARIIPLSGRPRDYFETLVSFNQATSEEDRAYFFERLKDYKEYVQERIIRKDQMIYFLRWYYPVVREMVKWPTFKPDPRWIAQNICPRINVNQVKEALEVLLSLEMLVRTAEGSYAQSHPRIATECQGLEHISTDYHKQVIKLGFGALELDAQDRNFNSMIMSISPAQFELIRSEINDFQKALDEIVLKKRPTKTLLVDKGVANQLIETPDFFETSTVCMLNMQLFKVTKPKRHT